MYFDVVIQVEPKRNALRDLVARVSVVPWFVLVSLTWDCYIERESKYPIFKDSGPKCH